MSAFEFEAPEVPGRPRDRARAAAGGRDEVPGALASSGVGPPGLVLRPSLPHRTLSGVEAIADLAARVRCDRETVVCRGGGA